MRNYSLKNTAGAQVQASLLFPAFFLTEGKLICETRTMADRDDPGLKKSISGLRKPAVLLSHSFLPLVSY